MGRLGGTGGGEGRLGGQQHLLESPGSVWDVSEEQEAVRDVSEEQQHLLESPGSVRDVSEEQEAVRDVSEDSSTCWRVRGQYGTSRRNRRR